MFNLNSKKGMTLIEIVGVVLIIALIAMFAVPRVLEKYKDAQATKVISDVKTVSDAIDIAEMKAYAKSDGTFEFKDLLSEDTVEFETQTDKEVIEGAIQELLGEDVEMNNFKFITGDEIEKGVNKTGEDLVLAEIDSLNTEHGLRNFVVYYDEENNEKGLNGTVVYIGDTIENGDGEIIVGIPKAKNTDTTDTDNE